MDISGSVLQLPKITIYECDECETRFEYCTDELRSANATFCSKKCRDIYLQREFQQEQELRRNEDEYIKNLN